MIKIIIYDDPILHKIGDEYMKRVDKYYKWYKEKLKEKSK